MEKDEEFLHGFFTFLSQLCFEKAKEHVEKEKELNRTQLNCSTLWAAFLAQLQQLALAEKGYIEIAFLQNKNKGFLRKDNSLRSVYETIKIEIKRIEDVSRVQESKITNHCVNVQEFVGGRISLIDFYDKVYTGGSNNMLKYNEMLQSIEGLIEKTSPIFTGISLTPIKAIFSLECAILEQLFKALIELQRLQFLPSLALIHGAHTRLTAWENKIQNRETWKLGFLKNTQLPALFQWHMKFKGAVLSKFSLFFHDTLAAQTTSSDMRQLCSKLQFDYYYKMLNFQKKYDVLSVMLVSQTQVSCDTTCSDSFPVIISCPSKQLPQLDEILKVITDANVETPNERIIFKYCMQDKLMCIYTIIEPNIYMILVFESKKTEKDVYITNFITEFSTNLRCTKIFSNLKTQSK